MDQKTLFVIFILILISSQLWNIFWDMGKSALYLVILLLVLTYINPDTANTIKGYGQRLLGLDSKLITDFLSTISTFILGIFGKSPKIILTESDTILSNARSEMFGEPTVIKLEETVKLNQPIEPTQPIQPIQPIQGKQPKQIKLTKKIKQGKISTQSKRSKQRNQLTQLKQSKQAK